MKTLRLLSCLLVIALSIGFVSCSDDDDDNGGFKGSKKLIAVNSDNESRTFKYDSQGRIIELAGTYKSSSYNGWKYTIQYSADKIISTGTDYYGDSGTETFKLQGGTIISSTYTSDNDGYEEYIYKYKDNQLTGFQSFHEDEELCWDVVNTWANGNIMMINFAEESYKWVTTYTYSDRPNRFVGLPVSGVFLGDVSDLLFQMGYFGKCPSNLMTKEVDDDGDSTSYTYEFDAEGYITKAIVSGDGYSEVTNGTYTFVYED